MSGRHHWTMRRLVVAMLMVHALSLAGLSPSHAAAANSSAGLLNDIPCNDLCKAYMAWSDRTMARLNPAQRQTPPQPRAAAHPKKPEQPPHSAAAARRPGLNAFARLPRQVDPAPPTAPSPPVEIATSQPAAPIADRTPAADGVAKQRADTDSATTELAETMPTPPVADPLAATQQPVTIGAIANGPPQRLPVSLVLALCALLAFVSCWWIRDRLQAEGAIW